MADDLQGMIANRLAGTARARLTQFYISQGYEPTQAAALAAAEMARRQERPEPGFSGSGADELGQMSRDFYRQNPSALSSARADEATLPGYDPSRSDVAPRTSYDPVMNRIQGGGGTTQFSSPMTQEDIDIARQTMPIPRGSAEPYGGQQSSLIERALERIQPRPNQAMADTRQGPAVAGGDARAAGETRLPSYTGDDIDAEMYSRRYGQPMSSYTGDAVDAAALAQRYGASRPAPRPMARPSEAPIPERPAGRMGANAEGAQGQGFFSRMFSDPYAGKSSRELYEMQQADPDNKGLYFRAAAKQAEEGMARGGTAGGGGHGKDAAIMKALEIIHHMIRGR